MMIRINKSIINDDVINMLLLLLLVFERKNIFFFGISFKINFNQNQNKR